MFIVESSASEDSRNWDDFLEELLEERDEDDVNTENSFEIENDESDKTCKKCGTPYLLDTEICPCGAYLPLDFLIRIRESTRVFAEMIHESEYDDTLFVFNDNEEDHRTMDFGVGNAVVRMFNRHNKFQEKPRSAGIVTGFTSESVYEKDSVDTFKNINQSFKEIIYLIRKYRYKRLIFERPSCDELSQYYIKTRLGLLSRYPVISSDNE